MQISYVDQQYLEFMKRDFSDPQSLFRPGAEANIKSVRTLCSQHTTLMPLAVGAAKAIVL